jgi:hypothetical protein
MIFFYIFSIINKCTWVEPFTFNMLKPLFISCILHLLKYIETIIQMLHITPTNMYSNMHNSPMFHIYIWMD